MDTSGKSSSNGVDWDDGENTSVRSHDQEPALVQNMHKEETRYVWVGKFLVFLVLMCAAVAIGSMTYVFTARDEESNFEQSFQGSAQDLLEVARANARQTLSIVQSVSTATTSFSNRADLTWPFVTIPDFEKRAQEVLELSGAELIWFTPIVSPFQLDAWGIYSFQNQDWIQQGLETQGINDSSAVESIRPYIYTLDEPLPNDSPRYAPLWQYAPAPTRPNLVNLDMIDSFPWFQGLVASVIRTRQVVLSRAVDLRAMRLSDDRIYSISIYPVMEDFQPNSPVRAFLSAVIPWDTYFQNVLPEGTHSVDVEVQDDCGTEITYRVDGPNVELVGRGLLHNPAYSQYEQSRPFARFARVEDGIEEDIANTNRSIEDCSYQISVFPTTEYEESYLTMTPWIYTIVVVAVFLFTTFVFVLYDCLVAYRQRKVLSTAQRTTAVVASLFPQNVQQRILDQAAAEVARPTKVKTNKAELQAFLGGNNHSSQKGQDAANDRKLSPPIADLFPETTILFGDIVGFTAWSSVREPAQVFILLETIYGHFDDIAKKRRVFKVETVGDCYVAVTGLPQPRRDHALAMVRFAKECLFKFNDVTKNLEVELGPETGDLNMRIGLHSGPVTAGVLRGERARFQLFGDTMNTASRMESNGKAGRIQISQETADLLMAAGKGHWLSQREDKIHAKGKGQLTSFWVKTETSSTNDGNSSDDDLSVASSQGFNMVLPMPESAPEEEQSVIPKAMSEVQGHLLNDKQKRLVDWNTDLILRLLRKLEARRSVSGNVAATPTTYHRDPNGTVLDEFKEIIELPEFDPNLMKKEVNPEDIDLEEGVEKEVREYVTSIAFMYRDNPFHNFEHCSHVAMSVSKLLSRIIAPIDGKRGYYANTLHDHTYGITSDPLTQFACVFSAIIHDVDHTGVPNTQLSEENPILAERYRNTSIAEQNSVDIAWELLQDESFARFRQCIYKNQTELTRFRQLIVNSVMATDIMDKGLKTLRNARWEKAFSDTASSQKSGSSAESAKEEDPTVDRNRKATIVIEHIIQASDVSHTMQHWHIYRKWNERLFEELYRAYLAGRAEKDPSEFWYNGEMGFFDFYIIPLAEKLKACGVFGVSSFEYLDYAKKNRAEWEARGQEIVAEMIAKIQQETAKHITPAQEASVAEKIVAFTSDESHSQR